MNPLSNQAILNKFQQGFSLTESSRASAETASISSITARVFKVEANQGSWLIKLVSKEGSQIEKENALLTALHSKVGELCIPYCKTPSGNSYLLHKDERSEHFKLIAMPFIENAPTFIWTSPAWTTLHSRSAGASLNAFHKASKACLEDSSIVADTYARVPVEKMKQSLLERIDLASKTEAHLFGTCLPPYEDLRQSIGNQYFHQAQDSLSTVVLHGDFHAGNVLFNGTAAKTIVDIDAAFSFKGDALFDLAYALIAFSAYWERDRFTRHASFKDALKPNHFEAFLAGYGRPTPLADELDAPLKEALGYSCMLFLLWAFDAKPSTAGSAQRVLCNASAVLVALSAGDS